MRTTIDIDDDVLAAARDLARAEGRTMGQVISDLARRALTTPSYDQAGGTSSGAGFNEPAVAYIVDDWPTFPVRPGPPVTNELIERLADEIAREDAEAFDHASGKPV
jgi:hypothetical protein